MTFNRRRCGWCDLRSPQYVDYHDNEWGVPVGDDDTLFEMLLLEGMQAGLSWLTILKKRENFRNAFDSFSYQIIARYSDARMAELLQNKGIIRNRLKVESVRKNARAFLEVQKEFGSFSVYLWKWVDFTPVQNAFKESGEVPAETDLSSTISKDLKKRGMNFVGPTIIYAYMQSVGLVNDHETGCFRYEECRRLALQFAEKRK